LTPANLVAAALKSRGAYEAIRDSDEAAVLPEELISVWQALGRFYDNDPSAKAADAEVITAYASDSLSNPKHQQAVARIVERLAGTDVSAANVRDMLRLVAKARTADSLAHALASRKEGEEVLRLIRQYESLAEEVRDDESEEVNWPTLLRERLNPAGRIKVAPKALNDYLGGGLLPGHNITLFARPEAGKTALALTMAAGFARRGHKVLYCGNEDAIQDLMVRALTNVTKKTREQIEQDQEGAIREGLSLGLGNLVMREMSPGTLSEIDRLVKQHQPKVLVVDQMRNIRPAKTDNFVQGLDHIAQGVRSIGKRNGLVTIGITQAGDSASGRPVLEMGDIDSSNTGIPGAADVLIGMGVTDTLRNAGQRVLSISKNKVSGRHGYFTVNIDEQTSRITSHV
jgi:archaellum biogenesis ATPase FlaH